jgi:hypothetical protein
MTGWVGAGPWVVLLATCARHPLEPSGDSSPARVDAVASNAPAYGEELRWVAEARQLGVRDELRVERVSRAELLRVARQLVEAQAPPAVMAERSKILVALGSAPEGFDLSAAILETLQDSLIGLYDPASSRVLVADDVRRSYDQGTRLHELAHGLVDQHFDLAGRFVYRPEQADRLAALSALAEGDATAVSLDIETRLGAESRERVRAAFLAGANVRPNARVPSVVQCLMASPYRDGLEFVDALRARGGWAAVDAAWRDPPETTEQVLHPDSYQRREPAISIPPGPVPGVGCRELYRDTLGESALRCLVADWVDGTDVAKTVAGWGGDSVATFACSDGHWVELAYVGDDADAVAVWIESVRNGVGAGRCLGAGWDQFFRRGDVARVLLPPADGCALLGRVTADRPVSGSPAPR